MLLSTLQWWAIMGALLTGGFISLSWVRLPLEVPDQPRVDTSRVRDAESGLSKLSFNKGFGHFVVTGLLTGLGLAFATQIPVVYTFGVAAVVLPLIALPLFGVFGLRQSGHMPAEQLLNNRLIGTVVALVLATLILLATSHLFEANLAGSEIQPVMGIILALAAGVVAGGLLCKAFGKMPIPGHQADNLARMAGAAMIALAIFLASHIPQVPTMFLWAVYLIIIAVFCGATSKLSQHAAGHKLMLKGVGVVVLIFGAVGLVSAAFGYRNFSEPFAQISTFIASGGTTQTEQVASSQVTVFEYATSVDDFDQMLADAVLTGRPVIVDFYADWCLDCKRMDRTTFKDPTIVTALTEDVASIKIDVTDPNEEFSRAIRKRFKVFGPPAILFFDRTGTLSANSPVYGYLDVEELTAHLALL